jgi:hypothetical protein
VAEAQLILTSEGVEFLLMSEGVVEFLLTSEEVTVVDVPLAVNGFLEVLVYIFSP